MSATPETCWNCGYYKRGIDHSCVACSAYWPLDPDAERREYEEKAGISIYENDRDSWTDDSELARALRATLPTRLDRRRAVMRRWQDSQR